MGKLRIIAPDGATSDIVYEKREPPIEVLQQECGGYVEHIAVDYKGKRRSAYVVDPFGKHPKYSPDLTPNIVASDLMGQLVRGPLVIDLGKS